MMRIANGFVGVTKRIRSMKFLYFIEGLVFVGISLASTHRLGIAAIPVTAAICHLVITSPTGFRYLSQSLDLPLRQAALWFFRPLLGFAILATLAWTTHVATASLSPWVSFLWAGIVMGISSLIVTLLVSIPRKLRDELAVVVIGFFPRWFHMSR